MVGQTARSAHPLGAKSDQWVLESAPKKKIHKVAFAGARMGRLFHSWRRVVGG